MKNSQKGFIIPLLIALIVILVGGGGYFYVQNKNLQNKIVENNIVSTTTVTQVTSDSPKVISSGSDMSSIDIERQNAALQIIKSTQTTDQNLKYLSASSLSLFVSDKQYEVISANIGPKFGYIVVDILNKKITDYFTMRGEEIILNDNKGIIFLSLPQTDLVIKEYKFGTEKSIVVPDTLIPSSWSYFGESGEGGQHIRILASSTDSITLGIYDHSKATQHPEIYSTTYEQVSTTIINLSNINSDKITISSLRVGDFTTPGIWKTTDYNSSIKWTIDYTKATYYETWNTGTTTLSRLGNFDVWLKQNKQMQTDCSKGESCGIPGTAVITGVVDPATGILHATIISQHVQ